MHAFAWWNYRSLFIYVCIEYVWINSCMHVYVYVHVPEYLEALAAVRNYVPDTGATSQQQLQHLFLALRLVRGQSCSCVLNKLTALLSISWKYC